MLDYCRENIRVGVRGPLQGGLHHGVPHQLRLLGRGKHQEIEIPLHNFIHDSADQTLILYK